MDETFFIQLLQNVGFPAFVTGWFIIRTEKVITQNTEALNQFKSVVEQCKK